MYFYDSISPIVEADSIDAEKVYRAARYDKGSADYINCPMNQEEYDRFLDALIEAQSVDSSRVGDHPARRKTAPAGSIISKAAFPSRRSRGEAGTLCASGR